MAHNLRRALCTAVLMALSFTSGAAGAPTKKSTTASATKQPSSAVTILKEGEMATWSAEKYPRAKTYSAGDITITLRSIRGSDKDMIQPVMVIERPRVAPELLQGTEVSPYSEVKFGVGSFDRQGTKFVYFQSFTGGAHCCNDVQVVTFGANGPSTVKLGEWDGEPRFAFPRDEDGDGVVDFVMSDDTFLYKYTSYAESMTPLQVINIVDGKAEDVSARQSFRRLFASDMQNQRKECLNPEEGRSPNGACAAYVASAARAGYFDTAWAEMLKSFQTPEEGWDLIECKVEPGPPDYQCPAGAQLNFDNFPAALRYFLTARGYL